MGLHQRGNLHRDISILLRYIIDGKYAKASIGSGLTYARIHFIVNEMIRIFRHAIWHENTYDPINDTFTITPCLDNRLYRAIEESRIEYVDKDIYGDYWNLIPPSPSDYMERFEETYKKATKGETLLRMTDDFVYSEFGEFHKHIIDYEAKNDCYIHDTVLDILSTYDIELTKPQEKCLYSFPHNSTIAEGKDVLISVEYNGFFKHSFSVNYDKSVSCELYRFQRASYKRNEYTPLYSKIFIDISKQLQSSKIHQDMT